MIRKKRWLIYWKMEKSRFSTPESAADEINSVVMVEGICLPEVAVL
tara:strand:+ start:37176 stop:37313 length:138 start_codon:yes stop_codon:yes gene_type:complete